MKLGTSRRVIRRRAEENRCPHEAGMIEGAALRRIRENPGYALSFRNITFQHEDGVLTVRGRVSSFHMKQVLQTLLRGLEGVERIDNQAFVASDSDRRDPDPPSR